MGTRRDRALMIFGIAGVASLALLAVTLITFPQDRTVGDDCLLPAGTCSLSIHGEILVASDEGAGMMNITVGNQAGHAFTSIALVDASPSVTGLENFAPFTYHDRVVSASNVLQIGSYSNGFYSFSSGGLRGTAYTITVMATMTNGQVVTEQAVIVSDI